MPDKVLVQISLETPRGRHESEELFMEKLIIDIIQKYIDIYSEEEIYHYNDDAMAELGDYVINVFEDENQINAYKILKQANFEFGDNPLLEKIVNDMYARAYPKKKYSYSFEKKNKNNDWIIKCAKKLNLCN